MILGRFVSAQMNPLAWKQFHHLREDAFQRGVGFLFPGTERIRMYAAPRFHLYRLSIARKLRVGGKQGRRMARHLNFRNHGNLPLRAEGDDLTDLFLCIKAAVRPRLPIAAKVGTGPHRSELRQLGESVDLDAPALIVRQVPVEAVELHACGSLDESLQIGDREKVTHAVEHEAAVRKHRSVHDFTQRQLSSIPPLKLPERLLRIVKTDLRFGAHLNGLRADFQAVALRFQRIVAYLFHLL